MRDELHYGDETIKKKLFLVFLVCLVFTFSLVGCAKCINTEYQTVEVEIVDEYHRGMYMTPIYVGKVMTMQTHPAEYRITVKYNDVEYSISGSDTYEKYKDKIGEYTNGTLEICTYDDGTVKYDILSLE